jgi:hypothetical protein
MREAVRMKVTLTAACALFLGAAAPALPTPIRTIIVAESEHPAVKSAAQILARDLALPPGAIRLAPESPVPSEGELVLTAAPTPAERELLRGASPLKHDGFIVAAAHGGFLVSGARPRSVLFAAGDLAHWRSLSSGTYASDPAFAVRTAQYHDWRSVPDYVAALGVNVLLGSRAGTVSFKDSLPEVYANLSASERERLEARAAEESARSAEFAKECHDADVDCSALLYGNDFERWSPALYAAVLKTWPSAKGTSEPHSWEKGTLCPSDANTWRAIEAYVREFAQRTQVDTLTVTFWDRYGIFCQDDRCREDGLNQFPNELYACVSHYHDALRPLGIKLIVRTWSSGVPHWLGTNWVHAPGYGGFGGSGVDLWRRVIAEVPGEVTLQTKVYESDCQPVTRFSTLLGHARPHPEIAEWQIAGQTTGRFYFPASLVDHTSETMRRTLELLGPDNGVNLFPGATEQTNFNLFNDIANSINLYAWRQLSWNPQADVQGIWMDWAVPIYGAKAAGHVVRALRLSEETVDRLFCPLGLGSDTNSNFAPTIDRRTTLLKYTNRYYLPDGRQALEPTRENIARVQAEKDHCLANLDKIGRELAAAAPDLKPAQARELALRFGWLREFAVVARALDVSLWRYRYLDHLALLLTTDQEQVKPLADALATVKEHRSKLFQFDPSEQLSCYDVALGDLPRRPGLGNPLPLMQQLYDESEKRVLAATGP